MQAWRVVSFALAILGAACASARRASAPAPSPLPPPTMAPAASDASSSAALFEASVKPILVSSCMPCHFPGGKMYASLPFDDPSVVASHSEGVLRRIKDPEKREALEGWLRGASPP